MSAIAHRVARVLSIVNMARNGIAIRASLCVFMVVWAFRIA